MQGGRRSQPLFTLLFTPQVANSGNPVSMALVGQMRMQGYGCSRSLEEGKQWVARALETAQARRESHGGGGVTQQGSS